MTTSDPNMSASRGVPLCASKNESLSRWTGKFETRRHGGHVKAIFTVDVETNRLCPDTPIVLLALEQLILDGSHQVGTYDVEADDEIRSIHFEHLTVKFSMDVLVSVIRGATRHAARRWSRFLDVREAKSMNLGKPYHSWGPCLRREPYTPRFPLAVIKIQSFWRR